MTSAVGGAAGLEDMARLVGSVRETGQVSWFDADPEQASALLVEVAQWVHEVLSHYRVAAQHLSECWRHHPSVVDALLALRASWCAAYRDPEARPTAAVDWHIRQLPAIAQFVGDELKGCSELNHEHESEGDAPRWRRQHLRVSPDGDRLTGYARWWAAERGADATEPVPSELTI